MHLQPAPLTRRQLLGGVGLAGLAAVLHQDARGGAVGPHFAPKAKRFVHLFMNGGPSQVDTFDPKPLLDKYHGKPLPDANLRTERKTAGAMRSPFAFKRYGRSGLEVSDLFAHTASRHADDLCVIRSTYADVPNHEPSLLLMNCGDGRLPRPSVGSWLTYGLGSENANLPGFVVLCPGGLPIVGPANWRSAFLPGSLQGTHVDTRHADVARLIENVRHTGGTAAEQRRQLDLVRRLNERHRDQRGDDGGQLEARIQVLELAYRMQSEAAEAFDVSREPARVRERYGAAGVHGRQLLITRRLLERGVRV